ncbi:MAG: hypothetical protein AAF618_09455 [Pseudomonadota bacterium]
MAASQPAQDASIDTNTRDGVEVRMARIEADLAHLSSDVGALRSDTRDARDRVIALEVKVDHLPTKGFIVSTMLTALAVVAALVAYGDAIRGFLAAP